MKKLTLILSIFAIIVCCKECKNMQEIKKRDDSLKALPTAIDSITLKQDSIYRVYHRSGVIDSINLNHKNK